MSPSASPPSSTEIVLYAVVSSEGRLRSHDGRTTYRTRRAAERNASRPGDSVVVARIDLTVEPLFIRAVVL